MIEKEAKKWVKENSRIEYYASFGEIVVKPYAEKGFQKGAEFGYNKAVNELKCCANCNNSYGGEKEPYHDCGYCHAMQCICKLKLEEHTSDIYRMWEDKCERWEMKVN